MNIFTIFMEHNEISIEVVFAQNLKKNTNSVESHTISILHLIDRIVIDVAHEREIIDLFIVFCLFA